MYDRHVTYSALPITPATVTLMYIPSYLDTGFSPLLRLFGTVIVWLVFGAFVTLLLPFMLLIAFVVMAVIFWWGQRHPRPLTPEQLHFAYLETEREAYHAAVAQRLKTGDRHLQKSRAAQDRLNTRRTA